jgi:hypothetical protein
MRTKNIRPGTADRPTHPADSKSSIHIYSGGDRLTRNSEAHGVLVPVETAEGAISF